MDLSIDFIIRPLVPEDSLTLSEMLQSQPPGYLRYFTPFAFDSETILSILQAKHQDVYIGLLVSGRLVGFFMLRGWDEGFSIPSYGAAIDSCYSGRGFGGLMLDLAKVVSRLSGAESIMLKVHPENRVAKMLYERHGFVQTGVDLRSGNLIYNCQIGSVMAGQSRNVVKLSATEQNLVDGEKRPVAQP